MTAAIRLKLAVAFLALFSTSLWGETADDEFGCAKWIAMEQDSTIIFPHITRRKDIEERGGTLKQYRLPTLSKQVRLKRKAVRRAWVDICGLGQYELFINGQKQGGDFLAPGWTMYNRRLLYNEIDVTEALLQAPNRKLDIKVMLGGGMYDIPTVGYHKMVGSCGAPKMLFCLHIEYVNGKVTTIVSDRTWKASLSPVRFASIYAGEWYDATEGGQRRPVVLTKPHWDVPLEKQQTGTKVRVKQELPTTVLSSGLYDTRQNCSGIVRIKVKGRRGQNISLKPAELLKDGHIYQRLTPGYEWHYTLRGDANGETWQPQFSYNGFRYLEVIADDGVELLELTGLHTTTDAPEVGSFECSDTLLNQIHNLIDWAIRSNLVSISTDCPTREKLGWQEQNHLMAHSIMCRYDIRALMNKIAGDLADSQHDNGAIPTIAPEYTRFKAGSGFEDTPEWGASFVLCPWYTYLWYGDDFAILRHYKSMCRYMDYLSSRAKNNILDYGLGDWFDIGPGKPGRAQLTSVAYTATAMYYYELCVMRQIALHLGNKVDAKNYGTKAELIKKAFNDRFYVGGEKVYENGSQTGLAMALYMNLVTDSTRQATLDALVRDIESRDYALTAGDIGFRYVIQALQQAGRSDVIYKMNRSSDKPGYAYQLKKGATALTESWQAYDDVSNNHMMLGHLMEWLYSGLGGIRYGSQSGSIPQTVIIAPQMVGNVLWTKTSLRIPAGLVSCHWTSNSEHTHWTIEVEIPDGICAEVHLPDGRVQQVPGGHHLFSQVF